MKIVQNLIYTYHLTKEHLDLIFRSADLMQDEGFESKNLCRGKLMGMLFAEPSTRTKLSFEAAMLRLGGKILNCAVEESSIAKGESFLDTVKIISQYVDILVVRCNSLNDLVEAEKCASCPIINAGAGESEHPTQSILDLYTILKKKNKIDDLYILIGGDVYKARTIVSLKQLLRLHDVTIECIPSYTDWSNTVLSYKTEDEIKEYRKRNISAHKIRSEVSSMLDRRWKSELKKADVVYMTRIQEERHHSGLPDGFLNPLRIIGKEELSIMKKDAIIMHPLPKRREIMAEDNRSVYFDQAKFGMYIRMAILSLMLCKKGDI